jgi:hypothetical protein
VAIKSVVAIPVMVVPETVLPAAAMLVAAMLPMPAEVERHWRLTRMGKSQSMFATTLEGP